MKRSSIMRSAGVLGIAAALACIAMPAMAGDITLDNGLQAFKGDTAWMMTSSALVLLMTIPGLALYYGGLVRTKNMLSMLMQVYATVCLVCVLWALYGYSMSFTNGGALNDYVGGFSKAFLKGVTGTSAAATFS